MLKASPHMSTSAHIVSPCFSNVHRVCSSWSESVAPGLSGRCQSPCRAWATSLQPGERQETSGNHCTTIYYNLSIGSRWQYGFLTLFHQPPGPNTRMLFTPLHVNLKIPGYDWTQAAVDEMDLLDIGCCGINIPYIPKGKRGQRLTGLANTCANNWKLSATRTSHRAMHPISKHVPCWFQGSLAFTKLGLGFAKAQIEAQVQQKAFGATNLLGQPIHIWHLLLITAHEQLFIAQPDGSLLGKEYSELNHTATPVLNTIHTTWQINGLTMRSHTQGLQHCLTHRLQLGSNWGIRLLGRAIEILRAPTFRGIGHGISTFVRIDQGKTTWGGRLWQFMVNGCSGQKLIEQHSFVSWQRLTHLVRVKHQHALAWTSGSENIWNFYTWRAYAL